jgi:hypothetical protein
MRETQGKAVLYACPKDSRITFRISSIPEGQCPQVLHQHFRVQREEQSGGTFISCMTRAVSDTFAATAPRLHFR